GHDRGGQEGDPGGVQGGQAPARGRLRGPGEGAENLMSAHTSGPWEAVRYEHGWHIGPQPGGVCSIYDDNDDPVAEANARLIAVSPEMLAQLRKCEWGGPYGNCPECMWSREGGHSPRCSLGAVIAKAEGRGS